MREVIGVVKANERIALGHQPRIHGGPHRLRRKDRKLRRREDRRESKV